MKCIMAIQTGEITRVDDDRAHQLVSRDPESYKYVPKSEYKAQEIKRRKG